MRINSVIPKVNFNAIYKVKVDKNIFPSPNDGLDCLDYYRNNIFPQFFNYIDCKHGYRIFLESAGYELSLKKIETKWSWVLFCGLVESEHSIQY